MREALDGVYLDARSGDGHNFAAGKGGNPNPNKGPRQRSGHGKSAYLMALVLAPDTFPTSRLLILDL